MKNARWLTPLGSIILFASALFHSVGYIPLLRRLNAAPAKNPLEAFIKASWWTFAVELAALGVIVLLAHSIERGGRIVLFCAAVCGVTAALLFCFMGAFPGVYLLSLVTLLLLAGGRLQMQTRG